MNGAPSLDCCNASICGSGKCAASMAAENCTLCRKYASTVSLNIWGRRDFLRICAIFCRYWTCSFSCRNNQAIGPRLSAFSPYFYILILFAKWQWKLRRKMHKNFCLTSLWGKILIVFSKNDEKKALRLSGLRPLSCA